MELFRVYKQRRAKEKESPEKKFQNEKHFHNNTNLIMHKFSY